PATQSDASFAVSYATAGVTNVSATTERVSCYAPEVEYVTELPATDGYPGGGMTPCPGATTGEQTQGFATQDVSNAVMLVKDKSESDLRVDPQNPRHIIGTSKWFVSAEGYNHLLGFYESWDGGRTWPVQGHVPGYEGWTDNSDPVGAFDPWGNFYAVVLPYMFGYLRDGEHFFLSPDVNPSLPRSGLGIAVRPRGAVTPASWNVTHNGTLDMVARDGRVWVATSSTRGLGAPYTMSFTSSRDGGRTWARRRVIARHNIGGYRNTTFRAAFGEAFDVGTRRVGRFYPLYAVYENTE